MCNFFYSSSHLLGFSPYPLFLSFHVFFFFSSFLLFFKYGYLFLFFFGFFSFFFLLFLWQKDVLWESLSGFHSFLVKDGLKLSFFLFLFSELMFFFSVFWYFFDSSLSPSIESGFYWPPFGFSSPHFLGIPFLGTLVLLGSAVTVTWSHNLFLSNISSSFSLFLTLFLALVFLFLQFFEYYFSSFSISDGVFGSIFFFSTGFHGFHVFLGFFFLLFSFFCLYFNFFSSFFHLGFECSILYWHFVDVIWLGLYLFVYWWGGSLLLSLIFLEFLVVSHLVLYLLLVFIIYNVYFLSKFEVFG